MTDYTIQYRPERNTLQSAIETNDEYGGFQIEGHTTFIFQPVDGNLSQEEYEKLLENILSQDCYEWHRDMNKPYYKVFQTHPEDSYYHLTVEQDKHIALFVQVKTTEESVQIFHNKLNEQSEFEWEIDKKEVDITGSGPNPDAIYGSERNPP